MNQMTPQGHDLWRDLLAAHQNAALVMNYLITEADDAFTGKMTLSKLSGLTNRKPDDLLAALIFLQRAELVRVEESPLKTLKIHYRLTAKAQPMAGEPGR